MINHDPAAAVSAAYDPFAPDQLADPYPVYACARQEAPVFYSPVCGRWIVTRYDDIVTLLKVDVLKKVAAHGPSRNRVAIHIDAGELWNRTLHRHEPLAEVLVNGEFLWWHRHNTPLRYGILPTLTLTILAGAGIVYG